MKTMVWKRLWGALALAGILFSSVQPLAVKAAPLPQGGEPPSGPLPNGVLVSSPVSPADTKGLPPALPNKVNVETPTERQSGLQVPKKSTSPETALPDPLVQRSNGPSSMPPTIMNFEGIGNTGVLPPDPDGQVGPDHYVQIVNTAGAGSAVRVYDKTTGAVLYNFDLGNLWPANSTCLRYGYGDPVVLYDHLADRWLLTQFVFGASDYHECFAVSKGHTPTNLPADWWLYDFTVHTQKFNDYPKIGVWPDGYYMMAHQFVQAPASTWAGTGVWVFDRDKMIQGLPATFQYKDLFPVNDKYGGMLPTNLMGSIPPPAGSPNYFVEVDKDWSGTTDVMTVFGFHVDWINPASTSFNVVGELVAAEYNIPVCDAAREQCIDQPGGAPKLEAISDRLMMHAWYRNMGDHEAIVVNQTVNVGGTQAGIRWYELRKTVPAPTAWSIYQQGTFAPDSDHRWMGSIAMDHVGNIALGYSVSSTSVYPSIRYVGRLSSDPLGSLPQAEMSIVEGGGAQIHSAARWGDYSAMSVDPIDDCTFWYTNEYVPAGDTVWHTRIASFKFPNCAIGDLGTLAGKVTSAANSAPIPNAVVRATASITQTSATITKEDGSYALSLLAGSYDVTASAYGFHPETVNNVEIVSGTVTTQEFALTPAITHTVSGRVIDAAAGWPLYARITIDGYPGGPLWTDPETGRYQIDLAEGISYTLHAEAFVPGYLPQGRSIGFLQASELSENSPAGNHKGDFALQADPQVCIAPGHHFDYAYFQDFELSDGGYIITSTAVPSASSWAWGTPTSGPNAAHSGQNVWATNLAGNYGSGENGVLLSPAIDLSAYAGRTPVLEWWQWLKSEANYDKASLEISKDDGSTWTLVYGEVSGDIDLAWARHSLVLDPQYAVATFRLRFHFISDSSVFYPGWYVDDVGIAMVDYTPPEVYFSESFEDSHFPPAGWNSYDLDGGGTAWEQSTAFAHSGLASARHTYASSSAGMQDGWLVTPPVNLPGNETNLSFWERTLYPNDYYKHSLWICTGSCGAPPANFTQVAELSAPINAWREQTFNLAQFANQTVTLAFRYEGTFADAWYIDDVRVVQANVPSAPQVACVVQPGGLVVGNVYDGNTLSPLVGASVANDSGRTTTAVATPEDPAVDDAFYTLFTPQDPSGVLTQARDRQLFTAVFTATMPGGYLPGVETVGVVISDTVRQDLTLSSGALSVSPPALEASLELGQSLTETLTLSNTGQATTTFQIAEIPLRQVSGLRVQMPEWTRTDLEDAKQPEATEEQQRRFDTSQGQAALRRRDRQAYDFIMGNVYLAPSSYNVLILTPDVGSGGGNVNTLLAALAPFTDLNVTVWDPDTNGVPQVSDLLHYSVVIVGNDIKWNNMDKAMVGDRLADYIDAGGKLIEGLYVQSPDDWGLAGRYITGGYSPFTPATRDVWGADSMAVVDPSHPVMMGVSQVDDHWGHQDPGVRQGDGRLANWNAGGQPYIAVNNNVVALNQLLHYQSNWTGDVGIVLHNAVLWLVNAGGGGVPWLSEVPITGTLSSGQALPIQAVFDAAAVNQPGSYYAVLSIDNDTPAGPLAVPVTMTVTAPANYGRLMGTVTGLAICDQGPGTPVSGALVRIESSNGVAWALSTGADGGYSLWLDHAGSPYTLASSAGGFHASLPVTTTVTGGITTTVDFQLRREAPCLTLAPDRFNVRIAPGQKETLQLSINNSGAGTATFELREGAGVSNSLPAQPAAGRRDYPPMVDPRSDRADRAPAPAGQPGSPGAVAGWGSGADMPGLGRYRAASVCNADCSQVWVFGGGLAASTGSADVMYYDATTNTWTTGLAAIPNAGQNWQAVYIDGKFYLPGGYNGVHNNWLQIYDIASNRWSAGANLPWPTTPMAAALGGKLYIFGGNPGPSANVAVYDPATDSWTTGLAPMPTARAYGQAVAVGEYIYVVGGAAPDSVVERYHPATNTWETLPGLGLARGDVSLFAVGEYLYAAGGINDYGNWTGLRNVERYALGDAPGGSWQAMPNAPSGFGAAAYGCAADKMWSIGGQDESGAPGIANRYLDEGLPCNCGAVVIDIPWLNEDPITGTVGAGGSVAVDITFTALPTLTTDIPYTATLWLRTDDPSLDNVGIPITMTVVQAAPLVDLEPEISLRLGDPGGSATHRLVLKNLADQTETFQLSYQTVAMNWGVQLPQTTFTLAAGEQVEVLVDVLIPAGAGFDEMSVITLMVQAQSDPAVFDTAELRTAVVKGKIYFPVFQRR